MTSPSPASPPPTAERGPTLRLSELLKRPVVDNGGDSLGRRIRLCTWGCEVD